jgi:hypothetical protein
MDRVADALRAEWDDERLSDAARQRIAARATTKRARRHRRAVLAPLFGLALAVAAVMLASTSIEDGPRASEVRQRAETALSPGQDVLHYVTKIRQGFSIGAERSVELDQEVWDYPAGGRSHTLVREGGRITTEIVTTPDDTLLWSEPDGGGPKRLEPPPRHGDNGPETRPPFTATSLEELRASLPGSSIKGPFTDEATGREVYEIQAIDHRGSELGRWRLNYRVDASTFAPVRLVSTLIEAPPQLISPRPGDAVTIDFTLVERLAPEAAAVKLSPVQW